MEPQTKTVPSRTGKRLIPKISAAGAGVALALGGLIGSGAVTPVISPDNGGITIGQSAHAATNTDPLGGSSRQKPSPSESGKTSTPKDDESSSDEGHIDVGTAESRKTKSSKDLNGATPTVDLNKAKHSTLGHILTDFFNFVAPLAILYILIRLPLQILADLIYILFPDTRPTLADPNEDGQGSNLANAGPSSRKRAFLDRQWVSDTAVDLVKKFGGSTQALNQMGGGGRGYGMGNRGAFGGSFGGQSYSQAAQPDYTADDNGSVSILKEYIKRMTVVCIMVGAVLVVLSSSVVLKFGYYLGDFIVFGFGKITNSF